MEVIRKSLILEGSSFREEIRTIVKDIVTIYKSNDEGEFYLPSDINDKVEYNFKRFNLEVELIIQPSEDVNDFLMNAEYYREEQIITILIVYNPEKKGQLLYNIIGELNEIVSHELRHIYQMKYNTYDLDVEETDDPLTYYTQPHEIDAQVAGFKRMSKITKKPFEEVVRNWFKTHRDIHGLTNDEEQEVIGKILEFKI
jgi:hypothetical protein